MKIYIEFYNKKLLSKYLYKVSADEPGDLIEYRIFWLFIILKTKLFNNIIYKFIEINELKLIITQMCSSQ